jgi:signal transduction histidine kinase
VVVVVFSFVGWQMVSRLNRRLERLKAGVGQIAAGNFEVQLDDAGEDEIAFLARNFNLMSSRIKRLVQNLKESNAVRQRLFAHASHEIKSPLTSIKGFVDIIEFTNVLPDEQSRDLLPAVKKDLNRVIKITNDMLQLARLRDPAYRFERKKLDFVELLREEHSYFAKKASAQSVQADLVIETDSPVFLETDPDRISQILDNLWSNALKYGDPAGGIRTELVQHNSSLRITISNRVKAPLNVPVSRLFEPFYRNPADADKVLGSGLGLVIVKELVEKLGGRIDAELHHPWIAVTIRFPREMERERMKADS